MLKFFTVFFKIFIVFFVFCWKGEYFCPLTKMKMDSGAVKENFELKNKINDKFEEIFHFLAEVCSCFFSKKSEFFSKQQKTKIWFPRLMKFMSVLEEQSKSCFIFFTILSSNPQIYSLFRFDCFPKWRIWRKTNKGISKQQILIAKVQKEDCWWVQFPFSLQKPQFCFTFFFKRHIKWDGCLVWVHGASGEAILQSFQVPGQHFQIFWWNLLWSGWAWVIFWWRFLICVQSILWTSIQALCGLWIVLPCFLLHGFVQNWSTSWRIWKGRRIFKFWKEKTVF